MRKSHAWKMVTASCYATFTTTTFDAVGTNVGNEFAQHKNLIKKLNMKFEKNMQVGLESEGGKLYPSPSYSISLHEMPIKPGKETNWLDLEEEGNIDCNLCVRESWGGFTFQL